MGPRLTEWAENEIQGGEMELVNVRIFSENSGDDGGD